MPSIMKNFKDFHDIGEKASLPPKKKKNSQSIDGTERHIKI